MNAIIDDMIKVPKTLYINLLEDEKGFLKKAFNDGKTINVQGKLSKTSISKDLTPEFNPEKDFNDYFIYTVKKDNVVPDIDSSSIIMAPYQLADRWIKLKSSNIAKVINYDLTSLTLNGLRYDYKQTHYVCREDASSNYEFDSWSDTSLDIESSRWNTNFHNSNDIVSVNKPLNYEYEPEEYHLICFKTSEDGVLQSSLVIGTVGVFLEEYCEEHNTVVFLINTQKISKSTFSVLIHYFPVL